MPQQFVSIAFEIDHIVAVQHGGVTAPRNLALACYADNHHKGPMPVFIEKVKAAVAAGATI